MTARLANAVADAAATLHGNDAAFLQRVWATPLDVYEDRLRRIGFAGHGRVLDAGCGVGQWTAGLARANEAVVGIDFAASRIRALKRITQALDLPITLGIASVEALPCADSSFDAVYCYSVIMMTDVRRTLAEFFRVLKPGGLVHACANGLGWYLHNFLEAPNPTQDFNPRDMAVETIDNSLRYFAGGERRPGVQLVLPRAVIEAWAREAGFENVVTAPEGTLGTGGAGPRSFFQGEYQGAEGVYEMLGRKPVQG